jgi:TrpR family trp operon transcriptional repressor
LILRGETETMVKNDSQELINVFARIKDTGQMQQFFEEIFTPKERKDLALRWKLMKMLKSGMPQRKIASQLGISLCKITRGSKIIRNPASVTNQIMAHKIKQ